MRTVCSAFSLWCLVSLLAAMDSQEVKAEHNLTFMLMTSFGQYGFNSSALMPAADMALEDINSNPQVLPGYRLMYDTLRDSQCHHVRSLDEFFKGIQSGPVKLAVVGCGCSVATEPVAEISHQWNISHISYASTSPTLLDRSRFKRYFRNSLTLILLLPTLRSIMQHYNWTRILLLTQDENIFRQAEAGMRQVLRQANITVRSRTIKTGEDPTGVDDLFLESEDYRVFYLNTYSRTARRIICAAYKKGLAYPRSAWITFDWYPQRWWTQSLSVDELDCSDNELATFVDKTITLRRHPTQEDVNATTNTGISQMDFAMEFRIRAGESQDIAYGGVVYDAIWILALALNKTLSMVDIGNSSVIGTGCENATGSLVPLEAFSYSNEKMGCLMQWNIQRTNFSGVSGTVELDDTGTRIYPIVRIKQHRFEGTSLTRKDIAFVEQQKNGSTSFKLLEGIDDSVIYPSGIPPDGTPVKIIHTFHIGLVILFDILATLGIIFAVCCLLFNFIFKDRKIVKLTSPNLNYFTIAGTVLMYISTYFYLLPETSETVIAARCILEHWLFTIGYSLAFGTMLSKMWRVYQIFHNPKPDRKTLLKDHHVMVIILVVTGIAVLLLLLETAVPYLSGSITLERDMENLSGETSLGVKEENFIWVCYEASSPNFFWRIFIFTYLAILQIVGMLLAFQTRRVKIKGLNDSKFIATIIYISSIVLVALALVTFALRAYINIGTGVFVAGILTLTTIFLALNFIPKMVLLYQDPKGEQVGTTTLRMATSTTPTGAGTVTVTVSGTKVNLELESKVASLEKLITELRNENEALKTGNKNIKIETESY